MTTEDSVMATRLQQIQESRATALVAQPPRSVLVAALEQAAAPPRVVVPVPRRGRVFLRGSEGHGAFGNVTLTSPLPEVSTD